MNQRFEQKTFKPGECLFNEGDTAEAAYLIISGKVEIRIGYHGGNPQTLAILEKGEVIGEMSLIDDEPHMATAIAIEETVVSAIARDEFLRRVNSMDPVMKGIFKILVKRIRKITEGPRKKSKVNWSDWKK